MMAVLAVSSALVGGPALPVRDAKRAAITAASRTARRLFPPPKTPKVSIGFLDCKRRSRSTVDCRVTFTFPPPEDGSCTRTWRVQYRNASDHRLRTRPLGDPMC